MRLLDLFSGAGGAAMGYREAGFTDIVGVDLNPQKRYPFTFVQGDAIEYLREHGHEFDAVHASPPCQDHSKYSSQWGADRGTGKLLGETRGLLEELGKPYVIENVPGADMRVDYELCGCMFADTPMLRRVRHFEVSWEVPTADRLRHQHVKGERVITVTGHPGGVSSRDGKTGRGAAAEWRQAMGIEWMSAREVAQAIPPAYGRFMGIRMLEQLARQ